MKRSTFLFFCTEIFVLQKNLKSGFFLKTYIPAKKEIKKKQAMIKVYASLKESIKNKQIE